MDWLNLIPEGLRMFERHLHIKRHGFYTYEGDAEEICRQIVDSCWNDRKGYFMVSGRGNYPYFWARDFSWVVESLIELGFKEKVRKTLAYALKRYRHNGKMTVAIRPNGNGFDFPKYGPDTLASMLYSLAKLGDKKLVNEYRRFLNKEIYRFSNIVVDKITGLPKEKHFSSMKDCSIRRRSCYDLVMCYMVKRYSDELGLDNPLSAFDYRKLLMERYWTGSYFLDDLSGKDYISGDSQVFPFWSGLVRDKKILRKVIKSVEEAGLDSPLPLKYNMEGARVKMIFVEKLLQGWEKNTVWTHMGPLYVSLILKVSKKKARIYKEKYGRHIEKHGNFMEVLNPDGSPYSSFVYSCSDSMIWAANYLTFK